MKMIQKYRHQLSSAINILSESVIRFEFGFYEIYTVNISETAIFTRNKMAFGTSV